MVTHKEREKGMKKTKTIKAIALALLCTLLLGAAVGIAISANEVESGESVATIGIKNLAYNDKLNLAMELKQVKEGKLGLGVWAAGTATLTAENAIFITYDTYSEEVNGETIRYAFSQGIAAKDIDTEYVFAAVVESDGVVYIGKAQTYSVDAYLDSRLKTEGISAEQAELYLAVKAYGACADDVLEK